MPTVHKSFFSRMLPYLVFLSGATGLVYESLWMRSFGLIFGNTTHATTLILSVFMGGLALGSAVTVRVSFRKSLRAYAAVETGVGVTAILTLPLLHALPAWYGMLLQTYPMPASAELIVRTALTALIVLPTTILLGMTIPILTEFLTSTAGNLHAAIGFLYRTNTLGAAFGVIGVTVIFLRYLGVTGTVIAAAGANLCIGFLTWFFGRRVGQETGPVPVESSKAEASVKNRIPVGALNQYGVFILMAFASGVCSFGLEVLWTRSMALIIGSSFYSFNLMLTAFLLGIAAGTYIYEKMLPRLRSTARTPAILLLAIGGLILADVALIGRLPSLYFRLMRAVEVSFVNYQAAGFLLCFGSMFCITLLFGFFFPLLAHLLKRDAFDPQQVSGFLYAWNTAGAVLGALVTGFVLIPYFGIQASLVGIAALPVIVGAAVLTAVSRVQRLLRAGFLCLVIALLTGVVFFYRPWDRLLMTSGVYLYGVEWKALASQKADLKRDLHSSRNLLFYREGKEGVVSVTKSGADLFMAMNGKIEGGNTQDVVTQKLLAHIPLMVHPDPQQVLVIGWGIGSTAGSASLYPGVKQIDCAEIEPAMFEARNLFADNNFSVENDRRFSIFFKDGRNMLLTSSRQYDVIISQPSNPWISGVSNLFTSDFYTIALKRLKKDGIFCQWFHYYNMRPSEIKVQIRTFCSHFPNASLWMIPPAVTEDIASLEGDMVMIGSINPHRLDYSLVNRLLGVRAVREDLKKIAVDDALSLLCNRVMDGRDMLRFAGDAPLNTDDAPRIELDAPRGLYLDREKKTALEFSIHHGLASAGRALIPPLENFPQLAKADDRERASLYHRIGRLYRQKVLVDKAYRLLTESVSLAPDSAGALLDLAQLFYSMGQSREAELAVIRSISLDPAPPEAYNLLATIYLNSGRLENAKDIASRLIDIHPGGHWGYWCLALVDLQKGEYAEARRNLVKVLQLIPDHEAARKYLASLDAKASVR